MIASLAAVGKLLTSHGGDHTYSYDQHNQWQGPGVTPSIRLSKTSAPFLPCPQTPVACLSKEQVCQAVPWLTPLPQDLCKSGVFKASVGSTAASDLLNKQPVDAGCSLASESVRV